MLATLRHPMPVEGAIARLWPMAMGVALAVSLSMVGTQLMGSAPSLIEGAAEGPSTSCVGCHTSEVPEGAPAEPGATGTAMQRMAECRR